MDTRGILTLQFGHYSNFIGTHWWNTQEQGFEYNSSSIPEINHDVLYREGITNRREVTYTPRLLLVDLKGSLKGLSETGDLYEQLPDPNKEKTLVEWDHTKVEVQSTSKYSKTEFQKDLENPNEATKVLKKNYDFDKDVTVWSDFLYTRFHPRTVNIVKEYEHCNENTPFDVFPLGSSLWKTPFFEEDFSDKIRNYVEECDTFQGFHILSDSYNAFGGLTSSCLEYLRDEYDRKSILVFPVIPSHYPIDSEINQTQATLNDSIRTVNLALSFSQFAAHSSFFVPLSTTSKSWRHPGPKREFKNVKYNESLPYHTSAILSTVLEAVTMKHRLKSSSYTLMDLTADLTLHGRKAVAASINFPLPIREKTDLLGCLDRWEGPLTHSVTPNCEIGTSRVMQHITIRGIPEERLKKQLEQAGKQRELPAYRCSTISEMLSMFLSFATDATANNVTVVYKPVAVKTPYPKIFDEIVGVHGDICDKKRIEFMNVEDIPVISGLHNCPEMGKTLESLHSETRRIRLSRLHQFTSGGIEKDEFEECLDSLFTLRENYEDNYLL